MYMGICVHTYLRGGELIHICKYIFTYMYKNFMAADLSQGIIVHAFFIFSSLLYVKNVLLFSFSAVYMLFLFYCNSLVHVCTQAYVK